MSDQRLDEIRKERGKQYGPPKLNHDCIAMAWRGVLCARNQNTDLELTAQDVATMMLFLKGVRWSQPFEVSQDSYDDGGNYLRFANEFDDRLKTSPLPDEEAIMVEFIGEKGQRVGMERVPIRDKRPSDIDTLRDNLTPELRKRFRGLTATTYDLSTGGGRVEVVIEEDS